MTDTKDKERDPWRVDMSTVSEQARVVQEVIRRLEPQIEQVINPELATRIQKIYFAGCGDSRHAGEAARLAFDKYTGVQTEPLRSLEFSRYVVDYMPDNSLVFGISNSGLVSRTIEALILARQRNADTIAITGNPDGPLARAADASLIQTVPDMAVNWGPYDGAVTLVLGSFIASLLTLYLSGLRIAELRGQLSGSEVASLKQELVNSADIIARTAEHNQKTAYDLARSFWHLDTFLVLGAGPNYATAMGAAARILVQPNLNGVPQELEEWAHEQYFLTRPNVTPIFVIAPPGNSRDRAVEQIHGARDMGATVIAICDSEDQEIIDLAHWSMPIQGQMREEFTPLAYIVPSQLFATALHQIKGRPPRIPPYDQQRIKEVDFRLMFHAAIKKS